LFFKATTIHDAAYAYFTGYQVNDVDQRYLSQFIARNARDIYVAMNIIQVYGIRIGFILASMPLFILLYLIAGIDGMTERYIRRACSGRESADLNKIGRLSKLLFFAGGATLYLCLPMELSPFLIIAPLALVCFMATRVQWQFYKKYF
jgi:tetrahydromethanopterin S-methyltransferase subunit F